MKARPDVRQCALPSGSRLGQSLPRLDYHDSFEVCAATAGMNMFDIHAALLGHLPRSFQHLLVLRSLVVAPFGVRGVSYRDLVGPIDVAHPYAVGDRIGRWTLYAATPDELITGADDRHLDFRVSVLRDTDASPGRIILSTAVQTHNTLGRAYLAAILPFHRFGIGHLLAAAAQSGRLKPAEGDRARLA